MTTLIDRILKHIVSIDPQIGSFEESRKFLEAELTAVKGVDELTHELTHEQKYLIAQEMYEEYCASSGDGCPAPFSNWIADKCYKIKQTPVAEEYPCTECGGNAYEGYIVPEGNCKIAKGERLCKKCMEKREPDFIEQEKQLNGSQPKEVEIDYKRFGKMIRYILTIPMGKTYGYAMPYYILKIKKVPYDKGKRPQGIDR